MDSTEHFVDNYYSVYMDTDVSAIASGTAKVVSSKRRVTRETGYGFIHAVWILFLRDNRCVVSAHPNTAAKLEKLFQSVKKKSLIKEQPFRDKILDICRNNIAGVSLSMGPGSPKYACSPENLKKIHSQNVKEITDKNRDEVLENFSETGLYNLDYSIERKVAFAYYIDGSPISLCLVHETNSDIVDDVGGIFTLEKYRGKGYAKAVLSAATAKIIECGRTPIYGTSIDNIASQNTAKSVGYSDYAWQMSVTQKI